MAQKKGTSTLVLSADVSVLASAAIVGKKEGEGNLGKHFDYIGQDSTFGQKSWEKAESEMQKMAATKALEKAGISASNVEYVFSGDLLNQCTGSTFGLRELGIPLLGVYGACSTMALGLGLAALFVEAGFATRTMAVTSSHFCSAEKQFRFPLEYGGQRTPTAQWTATAAGACVLGTGAEAPPYVRAVTFGKIADLGVRDANNMGAAMAPAAAETLAAFFADMGTNPSNYDYIITGDLGQVGSTLLTQLLKTEGYDISQNHNDCGLMLYDPQQNPEVAMGGSGCGCSASVLCGYLLPQIRKGNMGNILFVATGALMSPTSAQQGESIPGVAHLLWLSAQPAQE